MFFVSICGRNNDNVKSLHHQKYPEMWKRCWQNPPRRCSPTFATRETSNKTQCYGFPPSIHPPSLCYLHLLHVPLPSSTIAAALSAALHPARAAFAGPQRISTDPENRENHTGADALLRQSGFTKFHQTDRVLPSLCCLVQGARRGQWGRRGGIWSTQRGAGQGGGRSKRLSVVVGLMWRAIARHFPIGPDASVLIPKYPRAIICKL